MAAPTITSSPSADPLLFSTSNGESTLRARIIQQHPNGEAFLQPIPMVRQHSEASSVHSSGTTTPVPDDYPKHAPSRVSVRDARRERRRLFPTISYQSRVSHFDPQSQHRDFRGFFSLFWIGLFIMVLTAALRNYQETGLILRSSIFSLFAQAPLELAVADAAMALSTALCLLIQKAMQKGVLNWEREGYLLQHALQAAWLSFWVYLPFALRWTWTSQVFFTLHALTLLMKIHSYSFYSGHLSDCQKKLVAMDSNNMKAESEAESEMRETLAMELTSPDGKVTYPQNLTTCNFIDYMLCPTLCYELSYPRVTYPSERIRMGKIAEKVAAVFGCVFLLTVTSEEFIVPVMSQAAVRLENAQSLLEGGVIMLESISMLLFPFMVTFLLVFLVIFEYVLGAFAEITCFADRHFYADWWNSTNWLQFARDWNIPVHRFLQRHVYLSSRATMSKPVAMGITFFISALAHELVMFCITKKVRGYGFVCQMLQLPFAAVQAAPFMRDRTVLNNVMFWFSMIFGLSMISALYVLV